MTTIANPSKTILISVDLSELRVAVLEDGQTVEAYIERRGQGMLAGNVYKGRVDNVVPGLEAAFVDIGLPKNGFLYVDDIVLPGVDTRDRRRRRIDELLRPGQEVLVQVVKDPMGTKGARVTMELSIAGRFLVLSPQGEGSGVSRRLPDGERERLRDAAKTLDARDVGVIVRTAAEGATEEDLARDLRFLRRIWAQVEARARTARCPSLVHAEADLSLRVIRDLLSRNVAEVVVDSDRQFRRILGWVRTTQPEFADRIHHYDEATPLFERYGVDAAIRSTLNRRVDLPSGGYLIFDYAEAFTVIDVNTGRFVGRTSRLEDTITRNNIEAAREVVRQLRLRDIGGIIVIDFIDMASAKNRNEVLKVLQGELEKDRTKTYVVEISPLGLVEMTRQNVTEGVREILTRTCPTCGGEGVVLSEETMAIAAERRLQKLARASQKEAFLVRVNAKVAARLAGPGGAKLAELERVTGKYFSLEAVERLPLEEVDVVMEGTRAEVEGADIAVSEGQELTLRIAEPHMYNVTDGVGLFDGYSVVVGGAIGYVGQEHRVRIERATRTGAFAKLLDATPTAIELPPEPGDLELPEFDREVGERLDLEQRTRPRRRRTGAKGAAAANDLAAASEDEEAPAEAGEDDGAEADGADGAERARRRRRRGGRGRRRTPAAAGEAAPEREPEPVLAAAPGGATDEAEGAARPRRRGHRGGRNRRRPEPAAGAPAAPATERPAPRPEPAPRDERKKGFLDRLLGR